MAKIILGLVGPIASGKEIVKKYIVEKYNAKDCKFSTSLRDVVKRMCIEESRENLQKLSTVLRSNFGEDLLAKVIASDASEFDSSVVVIDGVRRMSDIKYLNNLSNFYLVKIDADPKKRFERLILRNENSGDKNKTFEQFVEDHNNEADREIPAVMLSAKISLENNGSLEELYERVDNMMNKLLK